MILLLLALGPPAFAEEPAAPRSGEPVRLDPVQQIERQRIDEREGRAGRSGFWTSRAPAKNGAYRWRLLGVGLVLMGITGGGIVLLIRRANRSNAARQAGLAKQAEPNA